MRPLPPTDFCRPDSTYGHTLERHHPRPHRKSNPSRGLIVSCVCVMTVSGEAGHPRRADQILQEAQTFSGKNSCRQRGWPQEPNRADRAERRTRALRELPSSLLCQAPSCRQPVAAKDLESPPLRLTPPLLLGVGGARLAGWPRFSFPRPPAKENAFRKTRVPSAASSSFWVRRDRSRRPLGLGLLVTPPLPCHGR